MSSNYDSNYYKNQNYGGANKNESMIPFEGYSGSNEKSGSNRTKKGSGNFFDMGGSGSAFDEPRKQKQKPRGYRNIAHRTCYLISVLQLFYPMKDTVFGQSPSCQSCESCQTFLLVKKILERKIDIEKFVRTLNSSLRDYYLYEWHPSHEFLSKLFKLLMVHNKEQLSKLTLTMIPPPSTRSKIPRKKITKTIQLVCRSESIRYELEMVQLEGYIYEGFPKYLIVNMSTPKRKSLPEQLEIRNFHTKKSHWYRFKGSVTGTGQHAQAISCREDQWYFFDDDKMPVKIDYERFVKNSTSSNTVVELFLLERFTSGVVPDETIRKFRAQQKKHQSQESNPENAYLPPHLRGGGGHQLRQSVTNMDGLDQLKNNLPAEEDFGDSPVDDQKIPIYEERLVRESSYMRLRVEYTNRMNQKKTFGMQVNQYRFCPGCGWVVKKLSSNSKFEICICCEAKICLNCLAHEGPTNGKYNHAYLCDPKAKCVAEETQHMAILKSRRRKQFLKDCQVMNMTQLKSMRSTSLKDPTREVDHGKTPMRRNKIPFDEIDVPEEEPIKYHMPKGSVRKPKEAQILNFGDGNSNPQKTGDSWVHVNKEQQNSRKFGITKKYPVPTTVKVKKPLPSPPPSSGPGQRPASQHPSLPSPPENLAGPVLANPDEEVEVMVGNQKVMKKMSDIGEEEKRQIFQRYLVHYRERVHKFNSIQREAILHLLMEKERLEISKLEKSIHQDFPRTLPPRSNEKRTIDMLGEQKRYNKYSSGYQTRTYSNDAEELKTLRREIKTVNQQNKHLQELVTRKEQQIQLQTTNHTKLNLNYHKTKQELKNSMESNNDLRKKYIRLRDQKQGVGVRNPQPHPGYQSQPYNPQHNDYVFTDVNQQQGKQGKGIMNKIGGMFGRNKNNT